MQFARGCQRHLYQPRNFVRNLSTVSTSSSATDISPEDIVNTPKYTKLNGMIRYTDGSRPSRRDRKEGLIPGVLYGVDDDRNVVKVNLHVTVKDLSKILREQKKALENTIFTLKLDDNTEHLVTPRQLQINPMTDLPISINFLIYKPGNRMRIPITYVNEDLSTDLRRGCFVVMINRYVECVCQYEVPTTIVVDLTGVEKTDVIRLSNQVLPRGVRPSKKVPSDYILAVIQSAKTK